MNHHFEVVREKRDPVAPRTIDIGDGTNFKVG